VLMTIKLHRLDDGVQPKKVIWSVVALSMLAETESAANTVWLVEHSIVKMAIGQYHNFNMNVQNLNTTKL